MKQTTLIVAAFACLIAFSAAHAQAPPTPSSPQPPPQSTVRCTPTQVPRSGDGVVVPPSPATGPNATLSDKLAQSGGVLCPPPINSDIAKPPPDVGNTPVIRPPIAPDSNVSPK